MKQFEEIVLRALANIATYMIPYMLTQRQNKAAGITVDSIYHGYCTILQKADDRLIWHSVRKFNDLAERKKIIRIDNEKQKYEFLDYQFLSHLANRKQVFLDYCTYEALEYMQIQKSVLRTEELARHIQNGKDVQRTGNTYIFSTAVTYMLMLEGHIIQDHHGYSMLTEKGRLYLSKHPPIKTKTWMTRREKGFIQKLEKEFIRI